MSDLVPALVLGAVGITLIQSVFRLIKTHLEQKHEREMTRLEQDHEVVTEMSDE